MLDIFNDKIKNIHVQLQQFPANEDFPFLQMSPSYAFLLSQAHCMTFEWKLYNCYVAMLIKVLKVATQHLD